MTGILRLSFAHHVNHLDPAEGHAALLIDLKPSIDRTRRLMAR